MISGAPTRCRHPRFRRTRDSLTGIESCGSCGHSFSPEAQALGRRNRRRGNAKERASAKRHGTTRTGQYGGKDDFRDGMFAFQNKSFVTVRFPGWMSTELTALRLAWPTREPVLHIEESPGPGRKPRHLYVVDEATWFALHGKGVEDE